MTFKALALSIPLAVFSMATAAAQSLPGAADPGRVEQRATAPEAPRRDTGALLPPASAPPSEAAAAGGVSFELTEIRLEGVTAFTQNELREIYGEYLRQPATLATLYHIAGRLTERYREEGYFLSKIVVPQQEIIGGAVTLQAIEGYIAEVRIETVDRSGNAAPLDASLSRVLKELTAHITRMKPVNAPRLEKYLLLLRDQEGYDTDAIIEPLPAEASKAGAVGMTLRLSRRHAQIEAGADTFGSRFTGPVMANFRAAYSPGFALFDNASATALLSLPVEEVKYVSLEYGLPLSLAAGLKGYAGYSSVAPGYTLRSSEVDGTFYNAGIKLSHTALRSRKASLKTGVEFNLKNASTDILGTELYSDNIRALRLSAYGDASDTLAGITSFSLTFSQGLGILGASEKGERNLSRAEGRGSFTKLEASLARLQRLSPSWSAQASLLGQYAWTPLLSSEEFGYGGQPYGGAYDPSEIVGDHGIIASLELRYADLPAYRGVTFQPYVFYDIGKIWNLDAGLDEDSAAATAGFGVRLSDSKNGWSGLAAIAAPLMREIENPLYGNGKNPRLLLQLKRKF